MSNKKPSPEFLALLKDSGSTKIDVAHAAQLELAEALTTPLRKGVLSGDIVSP